MPRSPAPTDRGVDAVPERETCRFAPFQGAHGLSLRTRNPHNQNVAFSFVRRCTDVLFFLVASVRLILVKTGYQPRDYGRLLCVCGGRIWERHILCNSGVLAWTPVGKQMGPRIPVRVTPHSSAHPNNTGGRRRRVQRLASTAFSERAATTKNGNGKRDEARREGTCSTCALMGEGAKPPEGCEGINGGAALFIFLRSLQNYHILE